MSSAKWRPFVLGLNVLKSASFLVNLLIWRKFTSIEYYYTPGQLSWYTWLTSSIRLSVCPFCWAHCWHDVVTWKCFQHYWTFVKGIHKSLTDSHHNFSEILNEIYTFLPRPQCVKGWFSKFPPFILLNIFIFTNTRCLTVNRDNKGWVGKNTSYPIGGSVKSSTTNICCRLSPTWLQGCAMIDCYTVLVWWNWGMRHGLQLVGINLLQIGWSKYRLGLPMLQ